MYIIRGTLHDCLEKGHSNSTVILTHSAAKMFYCEKVRYFNGVYSIHNTENITGLLGEIYFSSHCEKNISLVNSIHLWNILKHSKRNFVSRCGHVTSSN